MSSKHYTINYLEDTGRFLKGLKEHSYSIFKKIGSGTIIDLGCGTGMDVIGMSNLLGGDVEIIGIDHDTAMLEKAKESGNDIANIGFMLSEAHHIPFGDEAVSGIRAERLIQHLKEPELVFAEMHRVLKAGNPLAIIETDWQSLIFYNGHGTIEKKISQYLSNVKINNGEAARNLTTYLEKSNFENIEIEIFPFVLKSLADANQYLWIGAILQEMQLKNELSLEEYSLFTAALENADLKGYFACSINMVVVTAVKNNA